MVSCKTGLAHASVYRALKIFNGQLHGQLMGSALKLLVLGLVRLLFGTCAIQASGLHGHVSFLTT